MSKLGYSISWENREQHSSLFKVKKKIEKLKDEAIKALSLYSDGYIKFKRPIKVKEKFEGIKLKAIGLYVEAFEDEKAFLCRVKDCPIDFGYYDSISVEDLTYDSIFSLIDTIIDGDATIYSKEEVEKRLEKGEGII